MCRLAGTGSDRSIEIAIKKAGEIVRKLWQWVTVILGAATLTAGLAVSATQAGATEQSTIHITSAIQITQPLHYAALASCTSDRHYEGSW